MVAVRNSRHTFGIIEKAADFTVSVPRDDMTDELTFCGTNSGRTYDKFHDCGPKPGRAQETRSPTIQFPGIHFECKTVYKSAMVPVLLDPGYQRLYANTDLHTLYFGELVPCDEI